MAEKSSKLSKSPIIEMLIDMLGQDPVIELTGYVGRSDKDMVRLHRHLDLSTYVEFPKESILDVHTLDEKSGRVSVFISVSSEAKIRIVNSKQMSIRSGDLSDIGDLTPSPVFSLWGDFNCWWAKMRANSLYRKLKGAVAAKADDAIIRKIAGELVEVRGWIKRNC